MGGIDTAARPRRVGRPARRLGAGTGALAVALAWGGMVCTPSQAEVAHFEVVKIQSPAFEGRTFGSVGTYDRIDAKVTLRLKPDDAHNAGIVDIDAAPRDAEGFVEAVTPVQILRPTQADAGNRRLFYEVLNRGSKLSWALFEDTKTINDLKKASDAGNGFLLRQGYTVVWAGWQGDVAAGGGNMALDAPVVPDVTGLSREEFDFDNAADPAVGHLSYPAASLDPKDASLTVREDETGERLSPKDLSFTYRDPQTIAISRPKGFDRGAIYEFIYKAKDPKVMGIGFAATRDVISFLRYDAKDASGQANPLAGKIDYAIGFGLSQSGRYLQDFLYRGFNQDEKDRQVFDGLMPHISGGKKTFTNYRFSQPGRSPYQHNDMLYPGSEFPFTYPVTKDALTGQEDGLLKRCLETDSCPKVIKSDSEIEFYQQRASLVVTDTEGKPLTMPDNVRLYFLSNLPHYQQAGAKAGLTDMCKYPNNPLNAGPFVRALLVAMDAWVSDGTPPPASRYPSRSDDTLVQPTAQAVGFPQNPAFPYTKRMAKPALIDFSVMPPVKKQYYPVFVPKTDADGIALAGVHLPVLDAPIATYTGWNPRRAGYAQWELCGNTGSMVPFADSVAERHATGDPRLSVEERYATPGAREQLLQQAAQKLVKDRLLLEEDVGLVTKPEY